MKVIDGLTTPVMIEVAPMSQVKDILSPKKTAPKMEENRKLPPKFITVACNAVPARTTEIPGSIPAPYVFAELQCNRTSWTR